MSQANSIALIVACSIFMMVAPGLAAATEQTGSLLPPLPGVNDDPVVAKCLSTLNNVDGCIKEVITAFFSHRAELIGSACCKAFFHIDNNCWPRVFPFNPFFPPLARDHCIEILQNGSPSPSPSSTN